MARRTSWLVLPAARRRSFLIRFPANANPSFKKSWQMVGIVNSSRLRFLAFAFDVAMSVLALLAGLLLRLGGFQDFEEEGLVVSLLLGAILPFAAATGASLLIMRTYRTSWRHASTA